MTPTDVGFVVFDGLCFGFAFFKFRLIQTGFKHLHRRIAVFMLRSVVLALGNNPGRDMGHTYRRIGPVNVLTTGPGCTIGINAKILIENFDLNIVINPRIHPDR